MAEEAKVIELTQAGKSTEALVLTLIQRARDKDGEALFSSSDRLKLMRLADPKVILRIITEMNDLGSQQRPLLGVFRRPPRWRLSRR